jgi:SAM-dependent methyltransferase
MTAEETGRALPENYFRREDESDDAWFYVQPRLVKHIDDAAGRAAGAFYAEVLPAGGRILDLMSSWVSHLPDASVYAGVTGHGMNEEELRANPQLNDYFVQDLNREPRLPFTDGSFGGAILTVSAQYLTRPVEVFADVGRVLRPGAPFAITYSNRMFPTKAVAIWRALSDEDRASLLGLYLRLTGLFTPARAFNRTPTAIGYTDPLFAVLVYRLSASVGGGADDSKLGESERLLGSDA